ncbi:MAG: hypothetical protein JWQ40_289 [Segetibacter sp.]|nr:hypothetical protein [Segetibacter sp.]
MKKIIVAACFLFTTIAANAQSPAKSIFFELGGPGLASINYDMRFAAKEDGLGFRVGLGGFSIDEESVLFIPAGLNYLLGKDGKNYFEIGGGATVVTGSSFDNNTFGTTFGHLNFGYRLQPTNGGFMLRAAIVPVFNKYGFIPYYAGISFGYKF